MSWAELKNAMIDVRFVRLGDDEAETSNPLYNVTIWLADA